MTLPTRRIAFDFDVFEREFEFQLQFGYAWYCTVAGAVVLVVNFILAIPLTILTLAYHRQKGRNDYVPHAFLYVGDRDGDAMMQTQVSN